MEVVWERLLQLDSKGVKL